MNEKLIAKSLGGGLVSLALLMSGQSVLAADAETVLRDRCATCHADDAGTLTRIVQQRKTPEGWLMTLVRMQQQHGLEISDEERRSVVKYLADTQGLAPLETAGSRYALERRLTTLESFESENYTQMCARCHSGARPQLQRRTESEWRNLIHFHMGQFPTLEYQALSRDRDWFGIALNELVPYLSKHFPFDSKEWKDWQKQQASKPSTFDGEWSVSGHVPGKGGFVATMSVKPAAGADTYAVTLAGKYEDGTALKGEGEAVVYTGHEWRGHLTVDGVAMRQVFSLDGDVLNGRMFERVHDEIGADVVAIRENAPAQVVAIQPAYIKVGEETTLTIVGSSLKGDLTLPSGVKLVDIVERGEGRVVVKAIADGKATGLHDVAVGEAKGGQLAVYQQIDRIQVVPEQSFARIGDNGGKTPTVEARFEAEAYAKGPHGEFRIGMVPAKWSVQPYDEVAAEDKDEVFAGVMDAATGVFSPAGAGPNPERRQSTNNAGKLKVIAEVAGAGGQALTADAELLVTMQRWNNPPIP